MKKIDILNDDIVSVVLKLSVPILLCGFVQQAYNLIDLAIVGKYVDGYSIAIIGGTSSFLSSVATNFIAGLISGSIVIIGNYIGEKKINKINDAVSTSFILMLIMTSLFVLLYNLFGTKILEIFSVPESLLYDSAKYLKLYSFGFIGYGIFQLGINILRTEGETTRPTLLIIFSFIINIILDYIIIVVFKNGYEGVCFAYSISQAICAIITVLFIIKYTDIKLGFHFNVEDSYSILKIGIPGGITSLAFSLTTTYINSYFNLLEEVWITAYAIHAKIERIFWIFMNGLQFSITTFVSQNYGAKKFERIRKCIKIGAVIIAASSLLCTIIVLVISNFFISFFSDVTIIQESCYKISLSLAPYYVIYCFLELFTGFFKGVKKPNIPLVINLICVCALRVIWLKVFSLIGINYQTICACWPVSWLCACVAYLVCYIINARKLLK